jgi:hypothetical protein
MINSLKTWIDNACWSWRNGFYFRFDRYEDNIDRCAFFYEISSGWYQMYDPDYLDDRDPWNLGGRDPYYTYMMKVPEEDYDAIIEKIKDPPKYIEGLANLMKRKLP